ncbi:hypothetical protein ACLB2K_035623 [Fragaria x ananassa]
MWRLSFPVEVSTRRDRYLFTFANERDLQRVKKVRPWSLQCVMLPLNDFDGFSNITAVPLDSIWICVEILRMLYFLYATATARVVGKTLALVL